MDALAAAPGIKVVGSNNGELPDEAKGMQVMEDFLTRFPAGKVDAVYTHADMMARGAARAIAAEGRQNGLKIVSIDGENSTINMVAEGESYLDDDLSRLRADGHRRGCEAARRRTAAELHQAGFAHADKSERGRVQGQELLRTERKTNLGEVSTWA